MVEENGAWLVRKTPVRGEITDAEPPRPIFFRLRVIDAEVITVEGYAMAWTKKQVLVYYRPGQVRDPFVAWVEADDVRPR
jgi:hypothetical protein